MLAAQRWPNGARGRRGIRASDTNSAHLAPFFASHGGEADALPAWVRMHDDVAVEPPRSSPTLAAFVADVWAPRARRRLAAKTWERDAVVYRRHFLPALRRVEAGWEAWRRTLADPSAVRESVAGLAATRPYDLGRHTHSALMLATGMGLQRLARIQGHSIRVLDESYAEQLAEFKDHGEAIDPVAEIEAARAIVWGASRPP